MILTEVEISHMKTGRKFSVVLSVFPINPNTTFERKQRALDGSVVLVFEFVNIRWSAVVVDRMPLKSIVSYADLC